MTEQSPYERLVASTPSPHLLEAEGDIRIIHELIWHGSLETVELHTHVTQRGGE